MNVRSMNEIEGCPTVMLKITYPDNYPENELLTIEFDTEEQEEDDEGALDQDELNELLEVLTNTVSFTEQIHSGF